MEVKISPVGAYEANCYFVYDPKDKFLYVIDPGSDAGDIIDIAESFDFEQAAILLTHGHFDHFNALNEVAEKLKAKYVLIGAADLELLKSPFNNQEPYYPALTEFPPLSTCPPENAVYEMLPSPGHSPGGVCYYFPGIPAMFTGDTIFAGSVGRTDLPDGDWETLLESIKSNILEREDSLRLYPGHGPATTVGTERMMNPYLR